MNMQRTLHCFFLFAIAIGLVSLSGISNRVYSQQKHDPFVNNQPAEEQTIVVRMYRVDEFLQPNVDHPFKGFVLPGKAEQTRLPGIGGYGGGQAGGGEGGGGGGSGGSGGVFRIAPLPPRSPNPIPPAQFGGGEFGARPIVADPITIDELVSVIQDTVAIDSWEQGGGPGAIKILGNVLVISQTDSIHEQIDSFLTLLRKTLQTDFQTPITIKAIWLTIDENQLKDLSITKNQLVDRDVVDQLVEEHGRRGQIICFDRQTVHIAAGNLKSSVESVVPVVGQLDVPWSLKTQAIVRAVAPRDASNSSQNFASPSVNPTESEPLELTSAMPYFPAAKQVASRTVGYSPVTRWINYGAVLEVTPQLNADRKSITVDVTSISIEPNGGQERNVQSTANDYPPIDRHDLRCQQFQTTVRLPDSKPMLIGGSAIRSREGQNLQTYLILEAIVSDGY